MRTLINTFFMLFCIAFISHAFAAEPTTGQKIIDSIKSMVNDNTASEPDTTQTNTPEPTTSQTQSNRAIKVKTITQEPTTSPAQTKEVSTVKTATPEPTTNQAQSNPASTAKPAANQTPAEQAAPAAETQTPAEQAAPAAETQTLQGIQTSSTQNAVNGQQTETIQAEKRVIDKAYQQGTLASSVTFKKDEIPINPVELIIDERPECRIFGILIEEQGAIGGVAKRLICRQKNNFAIWNIEGKIVNSKNANLTIPFKKTDEGDSVDAATPVDIQIKKVGKMRKGYHIYLYDSAIAFPIVKIQLGQLMSYQMQEGGEGALPEMEGEGGITEQLPEMEDEGGTTEQLPEMQQ